MRGNHGPELVGYAAGRSIPAYAGEPGNALPGRPQWGVYPRVCGGTTWKREIRCCWCGLSPRMRGNQCVPSGVRQYLRSIPAYAGEPAGWRNLAFRYPVYPRVCGGTQGGCDRLITTSGLSPRMRGNQNGWACEPVLERSIPAYAGEPQSYWRNLRRPEVYPRVCGGTQGRGLR